MPAYLSRPIFSVLATAILIAALIPWAVSILRTPLHSDLVWLYEGFARLMAGQSMAESIFEPNPPLSLFTYALPYMLSAVTGLPSFITIFAYVMTLLAMSALVVKYVVEKITGADSFAPFLVMAAFVVSQSIMTTAMMGERDHLIGIALVPFVLMQYALTRGIVIPRKLQWAVFLIGAVIILLKPHHGLIPFCMIVHRMVVQRNLRVLRDADFISLAVMVLAYGALLFFAFADYRTIIFPDVVQLYLTNYDPDIFKTIGFLIIPGIVVLGCAHILQHKISYAGLIIFLSFCACASLIPYAVQAKGFFYHLFPAFGFFTPAAFLLLACVLEKEVKASRVVTILTTAALIGIAYAVFPLNLKLPTYDDYRVMPLTRTITDNCRGVENCSFMMFNDTMGITQETAYVTGFTHASRFPSFWFLPEMRRMDFRVPGSAATLHAAYADRVGEDLARYKPQTLIIGRFDVRDNAFFDFAAYWAVSKKFRAEWEHYEHTGMMNIAYSDYYPGTIAAQDKSVAYDIYRRREKPARD